MSRIAWAACACYVWPVAVGGPEGTCKLCREPATRPVEAPADGKARPLTAQELGPWASDISEAERAAWEAVDWSKETP